MINSSENDKITHLLTGRIALITGGSRGIGAAISKMLAKRGANVVVNYFNNEESANTVVSEIKTFKESDPLVGDAIAVQANVTDVEQIHIMMDKIRDTFGNVDIMVNNAMVGRYFLKPFLELKWEDFNEKFYDDMKAAYEITRATLPNMLKNNYGRIVYIATGSAKYPNPPGAIAFGTAKVGLVAFAKYIAQEYGRNGIRANIVSPGLIETDQNKDYVSDIKQQYSAITTLGRVGEPRDVAKVVAFLVSDDAEYLTGTYLPVDGGLVIGG
ncbi:MAG: SDR family oxidoreductase [Candidatus Nitrosocosmicus sp.]|nr:SDR family oxidoreductase [Candidatus Nitrosocosmicus sp.]